jgi:hypothetical protein
MGSPAVTINAQHEVVGERRVTAFAATLRSALNAAVREELIRDNPARFIELPTPRRPQAQVWPTDVRSTRCRDEAGTVAPQAIPQEQEREQGAPT